MDSINPFDIVSGKVVQNHYGSFWFKNIGYNVENNGRPIRESLHRLDGPAVIWPNGRKEWWIDGIWLSSYSEFKVKQEMYENRCSKNTT